MNSNQFKLMNLLNEINKNVKYNYNCAMLYFDFPELNFLHNNINKDDIYYDDKDDTFGLEKEPHVTLLYGLHKENKDKDIIDTIKSFNFYICNINNISLFEQEKYDVLKFSVDGKNLKECNKELRKFPYTNEFDYIPHLTIAYIKKGMGVKYIDKFKNLEFELIPKIGVYSKYNGKKISFKINVII